MQLVYFLNTSWKKLHHTNICTSRLYEFAILHSQISRIMQVVSYKSFNARPSLETPGRSGIGLQLDRSVFFVFLNIQAWLWFWRLINHKVQRLVFVKMLARSFNNLPESLSTPAALELSICCMIFNTFFQQCGLDKSQL